MIDRSNQDNGAVAAQLLAEHFESSGGKVLSLLDMQRWFKDELERRPSTTTLQKAREAFLARRKSVAQTPAGSLSAAVAEIERDCEARVLAAHKDRDDALASAEVIRESAEAHLVAVSQRAQQLIDDSSRKADIAEARASAAERATSEAATAFANVLSDAKEQISVLQAKLDAVSERATRAETTRDSAIVEISSLDQRITEMVAERQELVQKHRTAMEEEVARSDRRERVAAEQFSESTRHWGMQLAESRKNEATLSAKLMESDKALLAFRAEQDKAVAKARQEIVDAIGREIRTLSETVGGINTVHNTHLGGLRTALTDLGKLISEALIAANARGPNGGKAVAKIKGK